MFKRNTSKKISNDSIADIGILYFYPTKKCSKKCELTNEVQNELLENNIMAYLLKAQVIRLDFEIYRATKNLESSCKNITTPKRTMKRKGH